MMTKFQKYLENEIAIQWDCFVDMGCPNSKEEWQFIQMLIDRWLEIVQPKKWWQEVMENNFKIEALLKLEKLRMNYFYGDGAELIEWPSGKKTGKKFRYKGPKKSPLKHPEEK